MAHRAGWAQMQLLTPLPAEKLPWQGVALAPHTVAWGGGVL